VTGLDAFREYPATLKQSTLNPEFVHRKSSDLFAVRSAPQRAGRDVAVLTIVDDDGATIDVHRGPPPPTSQDADRVTPVYSGPTGGIAVPTGRVFVRFRDDVAVGARADELKRAGYRIAKTLPYAPNAAWLEADDGRVATALRNIARLEALGEIVTVEPQLLSFRAAR
jgi:hypothetical protein